MQISINRVNNVLRIILTSILNQELERKSSVSIDLWRTSFFVRHFTYWTLDS